MSKIVAQLVEEQVYGHLITRESGTPDYYKIRKIETEIHGEPITEYPGEWEPFTRKDHHKWHVRGHSFAHEYYYPGCLWCEDSRQLRIKVRAETQAEKPADRRRKNIWSADPVKVAVSALGLWMALMTIIYLFVWIFA